MERLYDVDAYKKAFSAVVVDVYGGEHATLWVALDKTAFFPEQGGQEADRGYLDEFSVLDVQVKYGKIWHQVDMMSEPLANPFHEGNCIYCVVDWENRFRNMQMHTGEHIFSGLVHSTYGYDNVGFHLSSRTATMDYNGKLTGDQLHELEMEANRIIAANRPVRAWYPTENELATLTYRSKKEIDGPLRLVEIEGVDLCACCAPHVRLTGEVGCFKIIGWENYKGGVRVSYRCGFRAMEDYDARLSLLTKLSQVLSVKPEELGDAVEKLAEERKKLAYDLVAKERVIIRSRIGAMAEADRKAVTEGTADNKPADDGRIAKACVLFLTDADASVLRYAVDEMKARYAGAVCAMVRIGADGAKDGTNPEGDGPAVWRYLIEQDGGDVRPWQQKLREQFGAKGGGPNNSVQGSVTASEASIRALLEEIPG